MARPRRTQRKQPKLNQPDWASTGICPACHKKIYPSKKAARNAARVHHPYDQLSPYQCRSSSPLKPDPAPWHIGHLDEEIITGEVTRTEKYDDGLFVKEDKECTYMNQAGLKCSLNEGHKPQPHLAQTISGDWVNMEEREGG